jgi:hypothetical protein
MVTNHYTVLQYRYRYLHGKYAVSSTIHTGMHVPRRTYTYTYRYEHRGVDMWVRGHNDNDTQAICNGIVRYRIL